MKCPYCDSDNRDDAVYCEKCEMPLKTLTRKRTATRPNNTRSSNIATKPNISQSSKIEQPPYVACPHCGAPLSDCTPISKTTVTSSGGGYGIFSGCCGMVLLGPLGLLCGLRKQNITSSSQTWWVCRKCGKEFIERESAKEVANTVITSAATTTLIVSLIWQFIFAVIGYSRWVRDIALLIIAGTWIVIPEGVKGATGYNIKQLLTSEERTDFYKRCVLYGIGSFVLGAVIGAKVMEYLFS